MPPRAPASDPVLSLLTFWRALGNDLVEGDSQHGDEEPEARAVAEVFASHPHRPQHQEQLLFHREVGVVGRKKNKEGRSEEEEEEEERTDEHRWAVSEKYVLFSCAAQKVL